MVIQNLVAMNPDTVQVTLAKLDKGVLSQA